MALGARQRCVLVLDRFEPPEREQDKELKTESNADLKLRRADGSVKD